MKGGCKRVCWDIDGGRHREVRAFIPPGLDACYARGSIFFGCFISERGCSLTPDRRNFVLLVQISFVSCCGHGLEHRVEIHIFLHKMFLHSPQKKQGAPLP